MRHMVIIGNIRVSLLDQLKLKQDMIYLQSTTESSVQGVELPLASITKKGVSLKDSFG